jgi:hypothetical protein
MSQDRAEQLWKAGSLCRRHSFTVLALCALMMASLALVPSSATARPPATLEFAPELDRGLLGEGRTAYRERADYARARDAYDIFKRNLDESPGDPTAAWHFGLACYYMGMRVVDDKEKERVYAEGRDRAAEGLKADPDCGPCHLFTAINHALWSQEVGIFRTLVGLPTVKRHLSRASELNPTFAGGAAYRVLAAINKVVPRMLGGGKKKARRNVEKAIQVAPYEALNYELLADILIDDYNDPGAAVSVARRGLMVPQPGPEYVESLDALEVLERIIRRYGTRYESGG